MHRYNCVKCGKGFHAKGWEEIRFDKLKCKKEFLGKDWKIGMFTPRSKQPSTQEKLSWIKEMVIA